MLFINPWCTCAARIIVVNPQRTCAARVTVVGCVYLSVCVSVMSHLTYGVSVRPENAVTYSAGNEDQRICGDLPETTAFKSYAAKHEQLLFRLTRSQLSPLDTQQSTRGYPTIVNNIQSWPKRCLLMPLARVGARTESTTHYSYNARRGQFPACALV